MNFSLKKIHRPDIIYVEKGILKVIDIKTGNSQLTECQKDFEIAYKTGDAKPFGKIMKRYLGENKEQLNKYQEDLKKFEGDAELLKEFRDNWSENQINKEWNRIIPYTVSCYPAVGEE
ncbi:MULTISPECIES: hypothetical protein [Bartonella]|uniref:Uncharacterized protein n=1 Tax=Bartonella grahamii TaxID=33045 RepID=A0A336NAX5_BARGR|nr:MULTISPECIES: hypothetical protein [Bartonella]SSZ39240.1 Uncharacterised protein [Bartonella grahamii]